VTDEFRFYYGAAAGSERKALRKLEEPNVAINWETQNNSPWDGIKRLLVDCGGSPSSLVKSGGEYDTSLSEYADYLEEAEPKLWTLRDYPCEPDVLDAACCAVRDHQHKTTRAHQEMLNIAEERDISGEPMAVVQGWWLEDYVQHIEDLRDAGVLDAVEHVGIGSVCGRDNDALIAKIIHEVADRLPEKKLHGFGVKRAVLSNPGVVEALSSADSLAYSSMNRWEDDSATWKDKAYHYLAFKRQIEERIELYDGGQTSLSEVIADD